MQPKNRFRSRRDAAFNITKKVLLLSFLSISREGESRKIRGILEVKGRFNI